MKKLWALVLTAVMLFSFAARAEYFSFSEILESVTYMSDEQLECLADAIYQEQSDRADSQQGYDDYDDGGYDDYGYDSDDWAYYGSGDESRLVGSWSPDYDDPENHHVIEFYYNEYGQLCYYYYMSSVEWSAMDGLHVVDGFELGIGRVLLRESEGRMDCQAVYIDDIISEDTDIAFSLSGLDQGVLYDIADGRAFVKVADGRLSGEWLD